MDTQVDSGLFHPLSQGQGVLGPTLPVQSPQKDAVSTLHPTCFRLLSCHWIVLSRCFYCLFLFIFQVSKCYPDLFKRERSIAEPEAASQPGCPVLPEATTHGVHAWCVCTVCVCGVCVRCTCVVCVHGVCARCVCPVCVHGACAWCVCTVCVHGVCVWCLCSVCVCSACVCVVCVHGVCARCVCAVCVQCACVCLCRGCVCGVRVRPCQLPWGTPLLCIYSPAHSTSFMLHVVTLYIFTSVYTQLCCRHACASRVVVPCDSLKCGCFRLFL